MLPLQVDPGWYEKHWLTERPQQRRRKLGGKLTRLAVVVTLLAGSGVVLSHHHAGHVVDGYQDWEQE